MYCVNNTCSTIGAQCNESQVWNSDLASYIHFLCVEERSVVQISKEMFFQLLFARAVVLLFTFEILWRSSVGFLLDSFSQVIVFTFFSSLESHTWFWGLWINILLEYSSSAELLETQPLYYISTQAFMVPSMKVISPIHVHNIHRLPSFLSKAFLFVFP